MLEINPKTIRFYEDKGIISKAKRDKNNYRYYNRNDYDILNFIKKSRLLGFSLSEIREILEIKNNGGLPCNSVINILEKHEKEVSKHIEEIIEFRNGLRKTIDEFKKNIVLGSKGKVCGLIESI